jgi:hypothetical protein
MKKLFCLLLVSFLIFANSSFAEDVYDEQIIN